MPKVAFSLLLMRLMLSIEPWESFDQDIQTDGFGDAGNVVAKLDGVPVLEPVTMPICLNRPLQPRPASSSTDPHKQ